MSEYTSSENILRTCDMVDISKEYIQELEVIERLTKMYTTMTGTKVPRHKIKIVDLEDNCSALVIADNTTMVNSEDMVIVYDSSHLKERIAADIMGVTVWHEITHLIDIVNYNKIKSNIGKNRGYNFVVWTEYNARYISMKLYMQYKNGTKEMFRGGLKDIQLERVNKITKSRLIRIYKDVNINTCGTGGKFGVLYELAQYLGQYSLFEELDYDYFKDAKQFMDFSDYNLEITQVKELYDKLQIMKYAENRFNSDEYRSLKNDIMKILH